MCIVIKYNDSKLETNLTNSVLLQQPLKCNQFVKISSKLNLIQKCKCKAQLRNMTETYCKKNLRPLHIKHQNQTIY